MRLPILAAALSLLCLPAKAQSNEPAPVDLLTLAKGAVLVSASVEPVKAWALTDGDPASNWNSSTKKTPPPYSFVFELLIACCQVFASCLAFCFIF